MMIKTGETLNHGPTNQLVDFLRIISDSWLRVQGGASVLFGPEQGHGKRGPRR